MAERILLKSVKTENIDIVRNIAGGAKWPVILCNEDAYKQYEGLNIDINNFPNFLDNINNFPRPI